MAREFFASLQSGLSPDQIVDEVNDRLRRIGEAVGKVQGFDTTGVEQRAKLSMVGNRIENVGTAKHETDAVNVRYLRDRSIVAEPGEPFVASRVLEAQGGVRVHEIAREPFDLVPLTQLEDYVNGAVSDAISALPPSGAVSINEDGSAVVATAATLNFVDPDLVLVTDAGGNQADVAMASYLPYVGRPGAITATLSTNDDATLRGDADSSAKRLFLKSSESTTSGLFQLQPNFFGQEGMWIGPGGTGLDLGGFFAGMQFLLTNDCLTNPLGVYFGGLTLNNGLNASTTFIGMSGNGAYGALTPSGPFDNFFKIIGTGVDADGNPCFNPSPASIVICADGDPQSGYLPGFVVFITTDRNGVSANRLWMRHDGHIGIGADNGYPDALFHVRSDDDAVVVTSVQGKATQSANLTNWEGEIAGTIANMISSPPLVGDTTITLVDSTAFASSGVIYLFDDVFRAFTPTTYTANNTGTGVITLTSPLTITITIADVYQTVQLSAVDKQGIFIAPSINDPGGGAVASPLAGMIAFDTNINKHVGYDGSAWNAMY